MKKKGSMKAVVKAVKSFKSKGSKNKRVKPDKIALPNRKVKKGVKRQHQKSTSNNTIPSDGDEFEHQLSELKARENSRYISSLPKAKFVPVLLPSVFETVKSDLAQQAHMNTLDEIDGLFVNEQTQPSGYHPELNINDKGFPTGFADKGAQPGRRPKKELTSTVSRRNMFAVLDDDSDDGDDGHAAKAGLFVLKPSILASASDPLNRVIDDNDI